MIIVEKCLEIGFPKPDETEEQLHYIARSIAEGHNVNALICHQIGIYNLQAIVQRLWELGTDFEWSYSRVYCPFLNFISLDPVLVIYMTDDQINAHRQAKRKPIKEVTQ